jgi:ferredoxin-thioredoxin reductase catalytic subunit
MFVVRKILGKQGKYIYEYGVILCECKRGLEGSRKEVADWICNETHSHLDENYK